MCIHVLRCSAFEGSISHAGAQLNLPSSEEAAKGLQSVTATASKSMYKPSNYDFAIGVSCAAAAAEVRRVVGCCRCFYIWVDTHIVMWKGVSIQIETTVRRMAVVEALQLLVSHDFASL